MKGKTAWLLLITIVASASLTYGQEKKAVPAKTVKKQETPAEKGPEIKPDAGKNEKIQPSGIFGLNLKLHVLGGGGLTYPGGDIALGPGTSADTGINGGYEAGLGATYMFLNDMVGAHFHMKYSGRNLTVSYSGTGSGDYTYHTSFYDFAAGVRGYFHAIYLYYEGGLSYGLKVGDWRLERPGGTLDEGDWAGSSDLNNNLALYIGVGVSYRLTPLISLEAGIISELGLLPVIKGPSPVGLFIDKDTLYTRYMGIRTGVTFSL